MTAPTQTPLFDISPLSIADLFSGSCSRRRRFFEEVREQLDKLPSDAMFAKDRAQSQVSLALLEGRYGDVPHLVDECLQHETKPVGLALCGVHIKAWLAARRVWDLNQPRFADAYASQLKQRLSGLPWDRIVDDLITQKGRWETGTKNYLLSTAESRIDDQACQRGELLETQIHEILRLLRVQLVVVPNRPSVIRVLQELLDEHGVHAKDGLGERAIQLDAADVKAEVRVAVWDTGVDVTQFGGRLDIDPNAPDGFEPYGIAFDDGESRSPRLLDDLGRDKEGHESLFARVKGYVDLRTNVSSPEAACVRMALATKGPDKARVFLDDLRRTYYYCHGTHVAGIALAEDPHVKLVVGRLPGWEYEEGGAPTARQVRVRCEQAVRVLDYFEERACRVVNMSWSISRHRLHTRLVNAGVDGTDAGRRANEYIGTYREFFDREIRQRDSMLFVAAAGNSDTDPAAVDILPAMLAAPNLLTVGAVGPRGFPTRFTCFGDAVDVFAPGQRVESVVPGGRRFEFSGTSMSAPAAANLAANVFTVRPEMTPAAVRLAIIEGSEPATGSDLPVLHPIQTIERVRVG